MESEDDKVNKDNTLNDVQREISILVNLIIRIMRIYEIFIIDSESGSKFIYKNQYYLLV